MPNIDITCTECGGMSRVVVNSATLGEYEGCVKQGDYTEQEWESITHYLDANEVRVLREKLCRSCQVRADGEEVGWYDLPPWVKGPLDTGDAALAEAKQWTYYRGTVNDDEEIYVAYTSGGSPTAVFFRE